MLDSNQLADYCIRRNLSPEARRVINHVRKSQPSRRVGSGTTNVACRFASRKMGVVIQAESHHNELPAVVGWEFDPNTFEYYDQPPQIKVAYQDASGHRRAHLITPDFFVLQRDFTGWVECKTEEWLKANVGKGSNQYVADGPGRWRYPPGEEFASAIGLGFRVRSSAETNWTAVRNAQFLSDYLDERMPTPSDDELKRAQAVFANQAWVTLKELLETDPKLTADAIYGLIVAGRIHVDLARDLLTEPERTRVFRDALSAEAYRAQIESVALPAAPDQETVVVAPGQSLLWDGKLWQILNVGDTDIFLTDEERTFTTLPRPVLDKLVREGTIRGLPKDLSSRWSLVEERVRTTSPDGFEEALTRYYSIFPEHGNGRPPAGKERALRKWRALYRKAAETTGFGFVGLLPKTHLRGNRTRKLDAKVIGEMNKAIDDLFAKPGRRRLLACWGAARNACKRLGLIPPSEQAFRNEVARRKRHDIIVAREGEKAAYDQEEFQWYLERTSPRHGERPFEIVHIDHTQLDIQLVGSRKGENLDKPWLTLMVDAFTRVVLAWVLSFEPPSHRSCMAVIRECVRRHGRIGKYVVVDKGSDFESTSFETLLAFVDSHKKTRPGGKPRYGSVIERLFGVTNDAFIHNLRGNNQALQKPRRLSKSHDPRRLAVWTLPEFAQAFEQYLERVYHAAEHSALGMSPADAMVVGLAQTGMREHVLIPFSANFSIMCMPSTKKGTSKIVAGRGVKINYLFYWTPEFREPGLAGHNVAVRYDPDDRSTAYAWIKDRWAPCRSEYASEFQGRSEREVQMATKEISGRLSRTGKRRAANASLIAANLSDAAASEKVLLERKRHQEAMEASGAPQPGPAEPSPSENVWENVKPEYLGAFE